MAESSSYGGFWIRSLAYAADLSILTLVLLTFAIPFAFMGGAGAALFGVIAAIAPVAYFAWFTASQRQATPGKQLCGLKVQHAGSGEQISLLRSIARELAKFVSAAVFLVGFLLAGLTQRKQGLHDMLAFTVVARDGQPRILLAILVALAGVLIPAIVIPLMFAGLLAGVMAILMGGMMGGMIGVPEIKSAKPVPQVEQKAAPRPQAPAAQPAPQAVAAAPTAPAAKPVAASSADTPETVYRNFHEAMLKSDLEGMRKWGKKANSDELDALSAAERKFALGMMSMAMPKAFQVKSSEVSADGNKATLYVSAEQTYKGKTETVRATVTMEKEGGAWKVDHMDWSGKQPSGPALQSAAAKPAAPVPAKPAAVESPKPVTAAAPATKPAPAAPRRSESAAAKPAEPVLQQRQPCVYKPVMTDEDIARCR